MTKPTQFTPASRPKTGSLSGIGGTSPIDLTGIADGDVLVWDSATSTWIVGTAGSSLTVEDEGTPLATSADTLNFVGAGVLASGAGATKTITIPGGASPSGADVSNSATQSIAASTNTVLTFDTETTDTDAYHSTSSNTGRLTVPTGLGATFFHFEGGFTFAAAATGVIRSAILRKNGSTIVAQQDEQGIVNTALAMQVAKDIYLADGDYLEVLAYQDSVGAINVATGATFSITRMGGPAGPTGAAGSSGSSVYPFAQDFPPASAHAKDDEFLVRGTSMDAKWTLITSASGMATDVVIGGGWCVFEPATSGVADTGKRGGWGFRQAAPTGDFTVTVKCQDSYIAADDPRPGVFIGYTGGAAYIVGPDTGAANQMMAIKVSTFSTTAEWGAYTSGLYTQLSRTLPQGHQGWYRIRYDSVADKAYWECDAQGLGFWVEITNTTSLTQPDYIGIVAWSSSGVFRANHKTGFGFFRVLDSIVF